MTDQQQQPQQAPQPPQQAPAQFIPQQQAPQQVPANLLANQVAMIEDYQAAAQSEQNAPDAYQTIIAQQQAQIEALIAQTNAQSEQITRMVLGGAQFQQAQQPYPFTQQQPAQFIPQQQAPQHVDFPNVYQPSNDGAHPLATFNPPSLASDEDFSLEGLASEIGKRGE